LFRKLYAEMGAARLSAKEVSCRSGIKYYSFLNKLHGRTEFTLKDMSAIKASCFPHKTIDELFTTEEDIKSKYELKTKTLYLCDPQKNYLCNKQTCKSNIAAFHRVCDSTSNVEYAQLDSDGKPIIAKE
jgi:hypothetical protein